MDDGIYDLDKEDRFIICCGAIAYPRHGGKFIRYGIYDNLENSIEFVILVLEVKSVSLGRKPKLCRQTSVGSSQGYLLPLGLCKP